MAKHAAQVRRLCAQARCADHLPVGQVMVPIEKRPLSLCPNLPAPNEPINYYNNADKLVARVEATPELNKSGCIRMLRQRWPAPTDKCTLRAQGPMW